MIKWLLDPPGWTIFPLILIGLALIYWDVVRHRKRSFASSIATGPARSTPTSIPSASVNKRKRGRVIHNIHTHGNRLTVGPSEMVFPLTFSVASRERVNMQKGALQYLARVRGKARGDHLSTQDFPDSPSFAVAVGERFLAINDTKHVIQGLIVDIKDDRHDDFDEVSFNYAITQEGGEIRAI